MLVTRLQRHDGALSVLSVFTLLAAIANAVYVPAQHGAAGPLVAARAQNASSLAECLATAGIETSLPTSASFAADTEAWNSRLSPVPAAVVFPRTEDDVAAALRCAAAAGTKVTTLGGNRSFSSMGLGRNDGALVVNLRALRVLEYDAAAQTLTYGGPVRIAEAAGFLWNTTQRALPHGRCPDVGMTGVAAAGFGTLSRASGTVLDNVVGVRVALANGSVVDADASSNPDLYFAVRGAASSVGVVLRFRLRTLAPPSQTVLNYTIAFARNHTPSQQDNVDALLGSQRWAQSADNNDLLSIRFSIATSATLKGFFYGSADDFAAVSASLLAHLPAAMAVTAGPPTDFWASEDLTTPGMAAQSLTERRYFYIASVAVPASAPLDNATAWALFANTAYAPKLPDASASGFVDVWGGEFGRTQAVAEAGSAAWKHDGNLLLVRWDIRTKSYDVPFADSSLDTMRAGFYRFVDAYKAAGGAPRGFTTYRDEKWSVDETAAFLYGDNWARLQQVKTAYDPGEMFNTDPQAVPALK